MIRFLVRGLWLTSPSLRWLMLVSWVWTRCLDLSWWETRRYCLVTWCLISLTVCLHDWLVLTGDSSSQHQLMASVCQACTGDHWPIYYWLTDHCSVVRRCSSSTTGPTLLCVQDTSNTVFGALVSSPIVLSDHFYGTGESFLFRTVPSFTVYNWSGDNPHFARWVNT